MDDATSSVLNLLKSHFEQSKTLSKAWEQAAHRTMTHLSRPGWPAESLRLEQKKLITQVLNSQAKELSYSNDMKSLLKFAQHAVALVIKQISSKSKTELEKQRLMGFIKAEQLGGQVGEVAATRAAARFLQSKRRDHRGKIFVEPDQDNRLLEILSLPKSIGAELPKQDIRGLILKSSLAQLLRRASCFSPELLKSVLGEEFLRHLKPVGFSDKDQKTLLIAVKSSSVAHEMSFRKMELLRRLHKIKEFEQVTDLRFTVS